MAIVQTLNNVYQLEQAFKAAGRGNQFSYEGLKALYDYLDRLGEDVELDVIGLCCGYQESTIQEIIDDYEIDVSDADGDEDEIKGIVKDFLNYRTVVCGETSDGFVFAQF